MNMVERLNRLGHEHTEWRGSQRATSFLKALWIQLLLSSTVSMQAHCVTNDVTCAWDMYTVGKLHAGTPARAPVEPRAIVITSKHEKQFSSKERIVISNNLKREKLGAIVISSKLKHEKPTFLSETL